MCECAVCARVVGEGGAGLGGRSPGRSTRQVGDTWAPPRPPLRPAFPRPRPRSSPAGSQVPPAVQGPQRPAPPARHREQSATPHSWAPTEPGCRVPARVNAQTLESGAAGSAAHLPSDGAEHTAAMCAARSAKAGPAPHLSGRETAAAGTRRPGEAQRVRATPPVWVPHMQVWTWLHEHVCSRPRVGT